MARVTVEDCIDKVHDRFELVLLAGQRAKNIGAGEPLTIERNNEKNTVLSLREIAASKVTAEALRETLVKNNQRIRIEEEETSANDEDAGMASEALREIKELGVVDEESLEDSHNEESAEGKGKDYSFDEENLEVDD